MSTWSNKKKSLLICLALALITLGVFYQVHNFSFVTYDDADYVYRNPNIQAGITPHSVKWVFTSHYAANWHPLTWLSHMLDWQLFGSNPACHHVINLVFHIANTLLLFIVLAQMTNALWQSTFVAALFALHPLHVESVAWVAERKDVLSTCFWMLTMWAYLRYVSKGGVSRYLLTVLMFALGLLAKLGYRKIILVAAAGAFDEAIATGQRVLQLCQSREQETLKEEIKSRLALFRQGRPYIEPERKFLVTGSSDSLH